MTPAAEATATAEQPVEQRVAPQDFLARYAAVHPNKPAIIDDRPDGTTRVVSYREFNEEANRIANALIRHDFRPGQRAVWCSRNAIEPIVFQQAVRKVGGQSIALNPRSTRSEVLMILNASHAVLAWVEAELAGLVAGVQDESEVETVVVFGGDAQPGQVCAEDFVAGCGVDEPVPVDDPDSRDAMASMIAFTSGTTGKPKGVLRGSMPPDASEARMLDAIWGTGPHVYITSGSITHGGPGGYGNRALGRGDTLILQRLFDPGDWLRLVDKYKVTISYCAPTIIRQVCNLPEEVKARYDRSSIQTIFAGAAKWSYALKLAYRKDFPENTLWELYGSTELASATMMRPDEHWGKPESCGRVVPGVEVVLVAAGGSVVTKPYEQGVLYAKSNSVFTGYDGDEEAFQAAQWNDGFFTCGDVAYFDEDGYYYICDRVKDMVVSGGVNIYPAEIEAVIDCIPDVYECAVFGVPDEEWGERVHAVVVGKPGSALSETEIVAYCREHLAAHKVPRSVEFTDELPHTPSGKLLKRELRAKYWAEHGRLV